MTRSIARCVTGLLLSFPLAAQAAEPADVGPLLQRAVIDDGLPMTEVQRYCDERIPRLAEPTSDEAWQTEADYLRRAVLERIVFRGQAANWRDATTQVQWLETIAGGPGYHIRKLRYEALPGLWIPALLYQPDKLSGRVPAILNVNGHTPLGKQYPPKQIRCINQAKRGMLALNIEWLGMGQLSGGGLCARAHEPAGSVRYQRAGAVLSAMKRGDRSADWPGTRRPEPRRRYGPVRRRMADDRDQRAGHPRQAGQSGGGLLELSHASLPFQGPGRFGADAE